MGLKVAITGNIGSGKSTLVKILKEILTEYQFHSIDDIVAGLYDNEKFCEKLDEKFGTRIKSEISDLVFGKPEDLKWLTEHSSYFVNGILSERTRYHYYNVIEFPLLFEVGGQHGYDYIVTAYCDEQTQIDRVKARNNFTEEKIKQIMGNQHSADVKRMLSNADVDTNCTMPELVDKAHELAAKIRVASLKDRFAFMLHRDLDLSMQHMWPKVVEAYGQDHRHYHTLEHIAYMLHKFDQVKSKVKYRQIVELAIWFHDLVYYTDERYPNNELASAKKMYELVRQFLGGHLGMKEHDLPVFAAAAELILATKGHKITSQYILQKPDLKRDCEIFLDLDLSVLFSNGHIMQWFEKGVREEFSQYDDKTYAMGRYDAMSAFLQRDKVLVSDVFAEQENQARCSLQRIVTTQSLRAGYF